MDVSGRYSCINLELGEFHLVTEGDPGLKNSLGIGTAANDGFTAVQVPSGYD